MTQQLILVGTNPNDGTGDFVRDAFIKTNANFTDLYSGSGFGGNTIISTKTTGLVIQHKPNPTPATDTTTFNLNYSPTVFTNQGTYTDAVWTLGTNYGPGGRLETTKPATFFQWENKFWNGAFVQEFHLISYNTDGTAHRPITMTLPWDSANHLGAGIAFEADTINLIPYNGGPSIFAFNNNAAGGSSFDLLNGAVVRAAQNNVPIALQQNSNGSAYVALPYLNAQNQLLISQPIYMNAANIGAGNNAFSLNAFGLDVNSSILSMDGGASVVAGDVTGLFMNANATGNMISRVRNSNAGASATNFIVMEMGGGSGGFQYSPTIGGVLWTQGVHHADSDKFKISAGTVFGTNDALTITAAGIVGIPNTLQLGSDIFLLRDTTGALALRNGLIAQRLRIFKSYTDASNGVWFEINSQGSDIVIFNATGNGTGASTTAKWALQINNVTKADFGNTAAGCWTFVSPFQLAIGGQFRICDAAVTHGLIIIGQSGTDNIIGSIGANENLVFRTANVARLRLTDTCLIFGAAAAATSAFPMLQRNAAVLECKLGDNSLFTGLSLAYLLANGTTFANKPATPVAGMVAYITDSTVATWGTTVVGGGSSKVLAWYNGTNWTVIGA
jgi:hypothetical protein